MTDYATIEALASRLCHDAGGTWDKKRTKKNHWRRKAADLYANQQPPTKESLCFRLKRDVERALFTWPNKDRPNDTKWWMFS